MTTLLVLGLIESVFLIVLIASQKRQIQYGQKILLIWLATIAGSFVFNLISFSGHIILFPVLVLLDLTPFVHGALLLYYTLAVIYPEKKQSGWKWLHALPMLTVAGVLYWSHYLTPNTVTIKDGWMIFKDHLPATIGIIQGAYRYITALYLLVALFLIYKIKRKRENYFSDVNHVNLYWLRNFILGALLCNILIPIVIPDMLGFRPLNDVEIAIFRALVYVVIVFLTVYVNYKEQSDLAELKFQYVDAQLEKAMSSATSEEGRYKRTGLNEEKAEELLSKLLLYMESARPYLNSKITLRHIADELGVSTNHLSQVINDKLNKNFFSFINDYRVNEFKEKVGRGEHDNYTLIGVALDCGFSSKSSFYTVFKKITGVTPADYIKRAEIEEVAVTN